MPPKRIRDRQDASRRKYSRVSSSSSLPSRDDGTTSLTSPARPGHDQGPAAATQPGARPYELQLQQLLRRSQMQVNLFKQTLVAKQQFQQDPAVLNIVQRVASAISTLRLNRAKRGSGEYWHPTEHEYARKNGRRNLDQKIDEFLRQPDQQLRIRDRRFYTDPKHPQKPMHLVFNVLSDDEVDGLVQSYADQIPFKLSTGTYKVPRYLRMLPHNKSVPVHSQHWRSVADQAQRICTQASFETYFEKARKRSNQRCNKYYRNHPEETRTQVQLVRDGVLSSIVYTVWEIVLESLFDSVQNGCREVHYKWDLQPHLPTHMDADKIVHVRRADAPELHLAALRFLQWSYFKKQRMAKFKQDCPQDEYRQIRREGVHLIPHMYRYQVSDVEFPYVPHAGDAGFTRIPLVQLRLKQRHQPQIKRAQVRRHIIPQLAQQFQTKFYQTYTSRHSEYLSAHAQERDMAHETAPRYISDPTVRTLSLCQSAFAGKEDLRSMFHGSPLTETAHYFVHRAGGLTELWSTSQTLMEHHRTATQVYLCFETYLDETFTFRTDTNSLERVAERFEAPPGTRAGRPGVGT